MLSKGFKLQNISLFFAVLMTSSLSFAAIIRETSPTYEANLPQLSKDNTQSFYALSTTVEDSLPDTKTRKLTLRATALVKKNISVFQNNQFWTFDNLGKISSSNDVHYSQIDIQKLQALISYPVRQPTFGLFPKRTECLINQKIVTPAMPEFSSLVATLKTKFSMPKNPSLVVVQKCWNCNILFLNSENHLAFIEHDANTVLVQTYGVFNVLVSAISTIHTIPFMNAESTVGHALSVETDLFRSAVSK